MKPGTRALVGCEVLRAELLRVIPDATALHLVFLPAALHTDMARLEGELDQALAACYSAGFNAPIVLFGGKCCPGLEAVMCRHGAILPKSNNCLDLMLGSLLTAAEAEGAIVFTPGWIRAWPSITSALGWDEVDLRQNLGRYTSAVVYDPGIEPLSDEEILDFFELTGLYVEVRPLDLEYFRKSVEGLMAGEATTAKLGISR